MWGQIKCTLDSFINKQMGIINMNDDEKEKLEEILGDVSKIKSLAHKFANDFTDKLEKETDALKSSMEKVAFLTTASGIIMINSFASILINVPVEFRASALASLLSDFSQNLSRTIREMEEKLHQLEEEEGKNVH